MKVIVNVESLTPPLTGIGYYTKYLLDGLVNHPDINQVSCFAHLKFIEPSSLVAGELPETLTSRSFSKFRGYLRRIPGLYPLRSAMRNTQFNRVTRKHSLDAIYHEPNYILKPFSGTTITTIHDLSYLHYPEFHPVERVRYMEKELPKTLQRASHIITDAEFVKNELVSLLGVAPQRITAIPLGVDPHFCPRAELQVQPVLRKHSLQYGRYLLAVGTLEPRKNLHGLLIAYMRLPVSLRRQFPLILVGGRGWRSDSLENFIEQLTSAGEIRHLGYVSAADLPSIYSGAGAFAFPSHYEGFGLPPLEAMASGIPVLTSNNSAMAEVVANAGILVDCEDIDEITLGLERLLSDPGFQKSARHSGLLRSRFFSWARCVDRTINVYRDTMK